MDDMPVILRYVALVLHGLAACVLIGLLSLTGVVTAFCVVPAVLAAVAASAVVRERPISLYAAFGLLIGHSVGIVVSAVVLRNFIVLVPMLILVAGAVWLLISTNWPLVIVSAGAILPVVAVAVLMTV